MTTRLELRTYVRRRFSRADKDDLIDEALDEGLRHAMQLHKFRKGTRTSSNITATDTSTSVALPIDCQELVSVYDITTASPLPVPLLSKNKVLSMYPDLTDVSGTYTSLPCCYVENGVLYYPYNGGAKTLRLDYYQIAALSANGTTNPLPALASYLIRYALSEAFASIRDLEMAREWERKAGISLSAAIYDDVTGREERTPEEFTAQEPDPLTNQPWNSPFVRSWNSG